MESGQQSPLIIDESTRRRRFLNAAILPFLAVVLLWSVHLFDIVYELELYRYGILPRKLEGLKGIFTSPFIHGDIEHLFNNSLPVFFLGWGIMYFYPKIAGKVVLGAWLVAGSWVWLSARQNFHIGASGVVYGLAGFLFTSGVLRKQRTLMALSLLIVFLYGSMLWGVLPIVPRISWEGHLWGMVSGVAMAFLYRHVPPAVSDPKPIHFDEEDDDESEGQRSADDISGLGSAPLRVVSDNSVQSPGSDPEHNERKPDPSQGWSASNTWTNGRPVS